MTVEQINYICYGCREMYGDRDDHKCVTCANNYIHPTFYFSNTNETVTNPHYKKEVEKTKEVEIKMDTAWNQRLQKD